MSPSRRGDKRTPLGTFCRSWGHREQLEDFPGEVGTPHHGVTSPELGMPPECDALKLGTPLCHPHSVTPQSCEQICVTPMVSHPEVEDTPTVSHHVVGDTSLCHLSNGVTPQHWGHRHSVEPQSWGHFYVTSTVSHPRAGDSPTAGGACPRQLAAGCRHLLCELRCPQPLAVPCASEQPRQQTSSASSRSGLR